MKKQLYCITLALALAGTTASAQSLANASFETPGESADISETWGRWGAWLNRECDWTPVYDQSCILGYHHWRIEQADTSGIYQDVEEVRGGVRYRFSIRANRDPGDGQGLEAQQVELRLENTFDGQQVTLASRTYACVDLATGEGWSALSVDGTAANDTLRVLVIVTPAAEGPRTGALKFDAAQLEVHPGRVANP